MKDERLLKGEPIASGIVDIPLIRVDQQTYDKFCEGQRVKMDGDSGEITILA